MPRGRVLSFISQWGGAPRSPTTSSAPPSPTVAQSPTKQQVDANTVSITPTSSTQNFDRYNTASPSPTTQQRNRADSRPSSRPVSMIQTYQPPLMEVAQDTLPELQPIFTYLNSHSNKLYQEGYFLKLHDLDSRGRPSVERTWLECFAQLVGTVLSLWDATLLDQAGEDGEVVPTFINLADASIKMIESLPMNGQQGQSLQNILSISTAANNRYLLHFNSFNSLTQWTAGIRLAIFEHATLQEAYTGSLIAGKGRSLNNIRQIMERSRFKYEDWARVRFGAGTPWRRCWCVVTPPDEKEFAKAQKIVKKQNIYDRSAPIPKGDVKFYETRKITKKTRPIATITEAYSAYAIYPQSKPLIDSSTLVKLEGLITIHSKPESTTEGFVFIMPEVHPAVSGFEIMLRFLFPVFDTFCLYGRPNRLIADVLDTRGLMFAMPKDRRYGYLDILDVATLIHAEGSQNWNERQWRKQMKELTAKRMTTISDSPVNATRRNTVSRTSLPQSRNSILRFDESNSIRSTPGSRRSSPPPMDLGTPRRTETAPPDAQLSTPRHQRSASDANGYKQYRSEAPSRLSFQNNAYDNYDSPPPPPAHRILNGEGQNYAGYKDDYDTADEGSDRPTPEAANLPEVGAVVSTAPPPAPVAAPPAFQHGPRQKPPVQPYHPPELRQANSQMDVATLRQLADASNVPLPVNVATPGAGAAWRYDAARGNGRNSEEYERRWGESEQQGAYLQTNNRGRPADNYFDQGRGSSRTGHAGNRLPTIPASPYIDQSEPTPTTATFQPAGPPLPEYGEPLAQDFLQQSPLGVSAGTGRDADPPERPGLPERVSSGLSIQRKPVPGRSSTFSTEDPYILSSPSSSSLDSLRNNVVDPDALDTLASPKFPEPSRGRAESMASSNHDNDSVASPDYASTKSSSTRHSIERPRYGVLKTVGRVEPTAQPDVKVGDAHYKGETPQRSESPDLPTVDFGPTLDIARSRPGTSGTITQMNHSASSSNEQLRTSGRNTPDLLGSRSSEARPESYVGGQTAAGHQGHQRTHSRSPAGEPKAPGNGSPGRDSMGRMAWQPGMTTVPGAGASGRPVLTPEEFVQQRAASASRPSPTYSSSHNRSSSKTPPISRSSSGDWSHLASAPQPRTPTRESGPPSRPQSRGASATLNRLTPMHTQHMMTTDSGNLSAREQEYIARATGKPLIQMARTNKETQRPQTAGLVGAIAAREKEKQDMRSGARGGALVQQAIQANMQRQQQVQMQAQLQRQQQQVQAQQQMQMQQMQSAYGYPVQPMGAPLNYAGGSPGLVQQGFGQPSPVPFGYPQQQQAYFPQPGQPGFVPQQGFAPQQQGAPPQQQPQQMQQQIQQQQMPMQPQPYGASWDRANPQGQGGQRR
ncbi:hypothetical protein H2199_001352 [Coniosporium tulheliwenetii]|uniref:Uncharacterized protein n=1 Tax=Coniosporium tulheliwenetii TaxID=3383036 RepID=A0ACC2ZLM3_9PEZI|nr:hypothetical protein H2199_001352 [Cladosporium sp. JES 115]